MEDSRRHTLQEDIDIVRFQMLSRECMIDLNAAIGTSSRTRLWLSASQALCGISKSSGRSKDRS